MSVNGRASLLVLTTRGMAQHALINSLARRFTIRGVIIESRRKVLAGVLRKRLTRIGPLTVLDQLLFKVLDILWFQPSAATRARDVLGDDVSFNPENFEEIEILQTSSVNSREVLNLVRDKGAELVVVSGVSLLGDELLDLLRGVPIINIHCGITPGYRGAHGAFWAVVNGDWDNVGVTVHFVDRGVDTGGIILQENIELDPDDNPRTLALKQNIAGIGLAIQAIDDIKAGKTSTIQRPDLESRIYSSPTMTAYLRYSHRMKERFSL